MSTRWIYEVVELSPNMIGPPMADRLSEELDKLGRQGWELVSCNQVTPFDHVRLILKKQA
ncbi:DUF4177 domain-containing protein [Novilysobacter spongiicola]|uniref:DUF4177 domain-containing protein n=1 Tax=Lysobacter spongiicola DSM 21749 TaxID=1122188 RepID=A0A1T4N870_9GAMM|nr:DUF4177 domain-containing protein [Lysobacter spongiicola]MDX1550207.1 DUF4177 domain-containing protein [Lysobacter spongiicola]SJZ75424.1 protein of unknown function [Lysobacter spongiicola DSM 21749]